MSAMKFAFNTESSSDIVEMPDDYSLPEDDVPRVPKVRINGKLFWMTQTRGLRPVRKLRVVDPNDDVPLSVLALRMKEKRDEERPLSSFVKKRKLHVIKPFNILETLQDGRMPKDLVALIKSFTVGKFDLHPFIIRKQWVTAPYHVFRDEFDCYDSIYTPMQSLTIDNHLGTFRLMGDNSVSYNNTYYIRLGRFNNGEFKEFVYVRVPAIVVSDKGIMDVSILDDCVVSNQIELYCVITDGEFYPLPPAPFPKDPLGITWEMKKLTQIFYYEADHFNESVDDLSGYLKLNKFRVSIAMETLDSLAWNEVVAERKFHHLNDLFRHLFTEVNWSIL